MGSWKSGATSRQAEHSWANLAAAKLSWRWMFHALIILAVLAVARDGRATDHEESFRRGVLAADEGEWRTAVGHFLSAAGMPGSNRRRKVRIYGMRYERYQPQYQLGRALFHLGDCSGAMLAFRTAQSSEDLNLLQNDNLGEWKIACGQAPSSSPRRNHQTSRPSSGSTANSSNSRPKKTSPSPRPQRSRPTSTTSNPASPAATPADKTTGQDSTKPQPPTQQPSPRPTPKPSAKADAAPSPPNRAAEHQPAKAPPPPAEPLPPGELGIVIQEARLRLDRTEAVVAQLGPQAEKDTAVKKHLQQIQDIMKRLRQELQVAIQSNDVSKARQGSREADAVLRDVLALETKLTGWNWQGR